MRPGISLIKILENEARDCEASALMNPSPVSEAFQVLSISYRNVVKKLREEIKPYERPRK